MTSVQHHIDHGICAENLARRSESYSPGTQGVESFSSTFSLLLNVRDGFGHCSRWNSTLTSQIHVHTEPQSVTWSAKIIFADQDELMLNLSGPSFNDSFLVRERDRPTDTEWGRPCEDRGRDWSSTATAKDCHVLGKSGEVKARSSRGTACSCYLFACLQVLSSQQGSTLESAGPWPGN
jgi:hypothetical protein